MSPLWGLIGFLVAFVMAVVRSRGALRDTDHEFVRENYAGQRVPVVLGDVLVSSANAGLFLALTLALLAGPVPAWRVSALVGIGVYVLFFVGKLDDRSSHEARGLRAHLESAFQGRLTTGIWKLVAGLGFSIIIGIELRGGITRVVAAALVIALSINVTNALDVRPGRALKWALLSLALLIVAVWGEGVVLVAAAHLGAGLVVLSFDLRERAMLGDAGSNPLGLVVGTALAAALPLWALLGALVILVGLQIAAETVTISRLIDAVPPLRWLDRLGRRN